MYLGLDLNHSALRLLLLAFSLFCFSCGVYAQSVSQPIDFDGTWSTCGFLADMTKVDTFTITKGDLDDCKEADCASTTWTFSTVDGERILERKVSIGCDDKGLQVSEEGDFGAWSYDPVNRQLVIVPYFEPDTYRYTVRQSSEGELVLELWNPTN